jgi:hypothetical protein
LGRGRNLALGIVQNQRRSPQKSFYRGINRGMRDEGFFGMWSSFSGTFCEFRRSRFGVSARNGQYSVLFVRFPEPMKSEGGVAELGIFLPVNLPTEAEVGRWIAPKSPTGRRHGLQPMVRLGGASPCGSSRSRPHCRPHLPGRPW